MIILAIESSCDETAIAILKDGKTLLANEVASQINWHKKFGGVVPEQASRLHAETINPLINKALEAAGITLKNIDAIAVTNGPGLEGALLVGLSTAKTLARVLGIPLIPINHLHGHIYSNFLELPIPNFPFICLIASGGHTSLVHCKDHFDFEELGNTRDDAAGEAFDKVARLLNLPYPGGPQIEKIAKEGRGDAFNFPRAMKHQALEFSFSGLKTAVKDKIKALEKDTQTLPIADLSASFQAAVIDTLIQKALKACEEKNIKELAICGGVTANRTLMSAFEEASQKKSITLHVPQKHFCTDNAAMIAIAAHYQKNPKQAKVTPNLGVS